MSQNKIFFTLQTPHAPPSPRPGRPPTPRCEGPEELATPGPWTLTQILKSQTKPLH